MSQGDYQFSGGFVSMLNTSLPNSTDEVLSTSLANMVRLKEMQVCLVWQIQLFFFHFCHDMACYNKPFLPLQCRAVLLVIDSCYAGCIAHEVGRYFRKSQPNRALLIFAACREGQTAHYWKRPLYRVSTCALSDWLNEIRVFSLTILMHLNVLLASV